MKRQAKMIIKVVFVIASGVSTISKIMAMLIMNRMAVSSSSETLSTPEYELESARPQLKIALLLGAESSIHRSDSL